MNYGVILTAGFAAWLLVDTTAYAADYEIDFKVTNTKAYGVVQFKANYTGAPGQFSGDGANVACTANAALNSLAAFNEAPPYLKAGFISTTEFTGPILLATCIFSSTGGAPTTGQFSISIDDWVANTHSTPPTVVISRIALH